MKENIRDHFMEFLAGRDTSPSTLQKIGEALTRAAKGISSDALVTWDKGELIAISPRGTFAYSFEEQMWVRD